MGDQRDGDDAVVAFYGGLAEDYHLVCADRWDRTVDRQAPRSRRPA